MVSLDQLKQRIQEVMPGADVSGCVEDKGYIKGDIVWDGFAEFDIAMKQIQAKYGVLRDYNRNSLVTELVRDHFGLSGLNIQVLYPKSPGETE